MNSGDMWPCATATRVSGTVKENAVTPRRPHHSPPIEVGSGPARSGVALSSIFMSHSSSDRIAQALREWVASAPAGTRLPSTRELVAHHEASPVTVQKALRMLMGQGLIESRPGVGTFVCTAPVARPQDYGWQTAALGSPQRSLPRPTAALRAHGERHDYAAFGLPRSRPPPLNASC
ncbi:winged helix-turn-helix domain-containing protein, partial [Corynebacterium diphtheriae]